MLTTTHMYTLEAASDMAKSGFGAKAKEDS